MPSGLVGEPVEIDECWSLSDPVSLIRALIRMAASSRRVDGFLFNIYVTSFGTSAVSNGIGLLLPPILSELSGRPVVVYMHNFVETQDVDALGYHPSPFSRWAVRRLEKFLLRKSRVVVPLPSQQSAIYRVLRLPVRNLLIKYAEPYGMLLSARANLEVPIRDPASLRILMLGSWGPQKDLDGAIAVLQSAIDQGVNLSVTITGKTNPQFPEYRLRLHEIEEGLDKHFFTLIPEVRESELLNLVLCHDVLLLPYRTTGGTSGAMMLGAFCNSKIVAYDLPQLRETASGLSASVDFVDPGDTGSTIELLRGLAGRVSILRSNRPPFPDQERERQLLLTVSDLIEPIVSTSQVGRGTGAGLGG